MKADEILRWLEAWSLMACETSPPLLATTTAVVVFIGRQKDAGCTIRDLKRSIPCSYGALNVQMHRLREAGVVETQTERLSKKRLRKRYRLTRSGQKLLQTWVLRTIERYRREKENEAT